MAPSGRQRFTVLDLLQLDLKENDALDLRCIGGRPGLVREIEVTEINRPGLELGGFYENFAWQRIQIFGRGENAFLQRLASEGAPRKPRKALHLPHPLLRVHPRPAAHRRLRIPRREGRVPRAADRRFPPPSSPCGSCACCPRSSRPDRACTAPSWRSSASACSSRATAASARARSALCAHRARPPAGGRRRGGDPARERQHPPGHRRPGREPPHGDPRPRHHQHHAPLRRGRHPRPQADPARRASWRTGTPNKNYDRIGAEENHHRDPRRARAAASSCPSSRGATSPSSSRPRRATSG